VETDSILKLNIEKTLSLSL